MPVNRAKWDVAWVSTCISPFFFPWFFAARWNSEALRPALLLIGAIKDRLSLQISRRACGCNSWRLCWISRTGVTVPGNALNITERCRATAAAAAGHSGISYGPNWSLRCLASNGMSLISFPADHICLFLLFLLLLLWCANIPCCPWLTDRGRTTHPPQRKWGQHECVMPFFFFFFLLLARCCRGYSTRVCRRGGNQISAVHKLPLIDCRWILRRSLEVNYCIMERFDIDSHPVRLVAESGIPCRWINKNRQLAPC